MVIGDAFRLDLEAQSDEGMPLPFHRQRLHRGPGLDVPADLWLERGNPWSLPRELVRVTFEASPGAVRHVELGLGRRAPRVLARLTGYQQPVAASVCAATIDSRRALARDRALKITPSDSQYFATGWYAEEPTADGMLVRWMEEHGAILVPSVDHGGVHIRLQASPPHTEGINNAPLLSLRINDVRDLVTLPMAPGLREYEWSVPDTAWVAGTNELLFTVSRTTAEAFRGPRGLRVLGMALHSVELTLTEP